MPADALWSFAQRQEEAIVHIKSGEGKESDADIQTDAASAFSGMECQDRKPVTGGIPVFGRSQGSVFQVSGRMMNVNRSIRFTGRMKNHA